MSQLTFTNHAGREREVRLFFHHDFHIMGNDVGDTAYYEPEHRAVIHYKGPRWFLINGAIPYGDDAARPGWVPTQDTASGLVVGLHQWACGHKEIAGREGTWRDAEDGQLSGNAVAQGSVDSTVGFNVRVPAGGTQTLYYWMCAGWRALRDGRASQSGGAPTRAGALHRPVSGVLRQPWRVYSH